MVKGKEWRLEENVEDELHLQRICRGIPYDYLKDKLWSEKKLLEIVSIIFRTKNEQLSWLVNPIHFLMNHLTSKHFLWSLSTFHHFRNFLMTLLSISRFYSTGKEEGIEIDGWSLRRGTSWEGSLLSWGGWLINCPSQSSLLSMTYSISLLVSELTQTDLRWFRRGRGRGRGEEGGEGRRGGRGGEKKTSTGSDSDQCDHTGRCRCWERKERIHYTSREKNDGDIH